MTSEEFLILLCQIELSLNPRPLTFISDDPSDMSALIPGHLLNGTPWTAVPDQDSINEKITLKRFQKTQQTYIQHYGNFGLENF